MGTEDVPTEIRLSTATSHGTLRPQSLHGRSQSILPGYGQRIQGEVGSPRVQLWARAGSANSQEQDKGPQEGATANTSRHPSLTGQQIFIKQRLWSQTALGQGSGPSWASCCSFCCFVDLSLPCASVSSSVKWDRPSLTSHRRPVN